MPAGGHGRLRVEADRYQPPARRDPPRPRRGANAGLAALARQAYKPALPLGTSLINRPVVEMRTSNVAGRFTGTNVPDPYSASSKGASIVYRRRSPNRSTGLSSPSGKIVRSAD